MSGIQRFEDLIAWQKARILAKSIYQVSRKTDFARDFGLAGQIQRAAVSIMSNIAEGFERKNPNEFHQFLVIARASCAEVRSQLYITYDIGYINQIEFDQLLAQSEEVARIVSALRISIDKKRRDKG